MRFNIYCNICDSQTVIKNNTIRMTCMCDDEKRILNLSEYLDHDDKDLYKMLNDNFEFVDCK